MEQKVCRVWTRTAATVFGARVWPATGAAHLPPGADRDLRGPHVALILRQLHRDPAPGQGDRLPASPGPVQLLEPHPHSETRVRSTAARTQAGHSITLPRRSGLWLACKYCSSCLCCLSVINNYNNVHVGSYSKFISEGDMEANYVSHIWRHVGDSHLDVNFTCNDGSVRTNVCFAAYFEKIIRSILHDVTKEDEHYVIIMPD